MKITHKELTSEEREQIIGAHRCGTKPATIAKTLGFPPSTVYDTVNRFKQSGSAQPKARPGRPQSLSDRDQRVVKRTVLAGRHRPLGEITNEVNTRLDMDLCQDTMRKYIARAGFSSCLACKKPLLRKKMSKTDWSGVKSTKGGTKSGRMLSFPMNRVFAFSIATGG